MRGPLLISPILLLAAAASPARANGWDDASTAGEATLVAVAIGLPVARGDRQGALQAGGSLAASFAVTEGLKRLVDERRPDGSDRRSFPSGHTSASFAAAATLHQRYGWKVGLPATFLAGFVGVARVEARKHFWHDVVAGAAIGEAAGFLITSRHDARVQVLPWGDAGGGGVSMAMRF
ncbi:MAG TPA: phosphatase PAP2 family protein [Allosphingosinicella sp.]|jgi:membrane-associated phospholipid phosphatase